MSAPASDNDGRDALKALLVALVKVALVRDGGDTARWQAEARDAQLRLVGIVGDRAPPRLDDLWAAAVKAAECDPAVRRGETVNPTLPTMSPLRTEQLAATPFHLDDAVQVIRDTASFG